MNIDKYKWLEFDRTRIATGTNQSPWDGDALEAHGGRRIALVRMVGRSKEEEKGDDR